jgi:hypothetical protein
MRQGHDAYDDSGRPEPGDQDGQGAWPLLLLPPPRPRVSQSALVLSVLAALTLGLLVGYAIGHSNASKAAAAPGVVSTGARVPSLPVPIRTNDAVPGATTDAAPAPKPAKVGDTITLTGDTDGEKVAVTLVKVADPAAGADDFSQPKAGDRFVAVQFRLANVGTAVYSDSPTNGAQLSDDQGQIYSTSFADTRTGQDFPGQVDLTPGNSALGVIVFELPAGAKTAMAQFGLDSGFGQKGQWLLR